MSSALASILTERVIIQRPSGERDDIGLPVSDWETVAECRAGIASEGVGSESEAMSLSAMPRFRVTIRLCSGINPGDRLVWKDRTLTIRQIIADPRLRDRMTLRCEEGRP